jgi:hypothetical protein
VIKIEEKNGVLLTHCSLLLFVKNPPPERPERNGKVKH